MYDVIDVTADAESIEPMGSKPKFWFDHSKHGKCLFKTARTGTGEDWSEKVAEQFAALLGIPHARYELATWRDDPGIVTPRMTSDTEELVHGNEILIELDRGYEEGSAGYRTPLHTVEAVLDAIVDTGMTVPGGWDLPERLAAADVFCGYLLLDTLIGNTDRHHENWAAIRTPGEDSAPPGLQLAPTFDHASSLGRNESPERMAERVATNDEPFSVEGYAQRAQSALFLDKGDKKPLSPLGAFLQAARRTPIGAKHWCQALARTSNDDLRSIVHNVPDVRLQEVGKEFVHRMVAYNRTLIEEACASL